MQLTGQSSASVPPPTQMLSNEVTKPSAKDSVLNGRINTQRQSRGEVENYENQFQSAQQISTRQQIQENSNKWNTSQVEDTDEEDPEVSEGDHGWDQQKQLSSVIQVGPDIAQIEQNQNLITPYNLKVKETPKVQMMQNANINIDPVQLTSSNIQRSPVRVKPKGFEEEDNFIYDLPKDSDDDF